MATANANEEPEPSQTKLALEGRTLAWLAQLPTFLGRPGRFFETAFASGPGVANAMKLAALMMAIATAAFIALTRAHDVELSNVAYLTVGQVAVWIVYGALLHAVAFPMGARRGIEYSVAAYLYVIGMLQPVLVVLLYALSLVVPGGISHDSIRGGLGGSGAAYALVTGRLLSEGVVWTHRALTGPLILFYFAVGLSKGHGISMTRAAVASALSFVLFFIAYLVAFLASKLLGFSIGIRLIEG